MRRRDLPDEAVDMVLSNPTLVRPGAPPKRGLPSNVYHGVYEGRPLKVYVEIGSDPPKVKSAVWED
jgi:hypothetical protein